VLREFGVWPEEWRARHYDERQRLLRALALIRAEEARPTVFAAPAETSPAGTMGNVEQITDLDLDMPFGIPAGELR
jgi:hypothetical protein